MRAKRNSWLGIAICMVLALACAAGAGCIDSAGTAAVGGVVDTAVNESVAATPAPTETPVVQNPVSSSPASKLHSGTTTKIATTPSGSGATLSQPTVTQGGYIKLTVTAPYGDYHVSVSPSGIIPHGQAGVDTQTPPYTQNYAKIHVDASGKLTFTVKSVSTDDITVKLLD